MLEAFQRYWHGDQEEIQLLLDMTEPDQTTRTATAAGISITVHLALTLILPALPSGPAAGAAAPVVAMDLKRATPLVAPRLEEFKLTQKEPQKKQAAPEIDLASLMPKPEIQRPALQPKPGSAPAGAPRFAPPPKAQTAQARMVEAPGLDQGQGVPLPEGPGVQTRAAEPPPAAPPKLAFERVGAPDSGARAGAGSKIAPPASSVEEAVRQVARGSGGRGLMVGDIGAGSGGYSDPFQQQSRPGQNYGTLELQSDPQGVDFRPYLIQVLAAVKRNWMAVIPESARFGRQGRVAIQFAIARNGNVPKLVIAAPSGTEALDRAAVAGISASNPFPPLPSEFKGADIRLQLVFSYNMPR